MAVAARPRAMATVFIVTFRMSSKNIAVGSMRSASRPSSWVVKKKFCLLTVFSPVYYTRPIWGLPTCSLLSSGIDLSPGPLCPTTSRNTSCPNA